MSTRPFIYLVQGQAERIREYLHLADRAQADAIFLTYDEPLAGATFFPDSTWSEGRNKMLEMARERGEYEYFIFSDDDVEFDVGSWTAFEDDLLRYRPAIGIPVMQRTVRTPIPGRRMQPFSASDEQVMGVHRDVIEDNLIFPYQSQFDSLHWWAACQIQKILMQTFYRDGALQFNDVHVRNDCHERYDSPDEGRRIYKRVIREWLDTQLVGGFRDFNFWTGRFHWHGWRRVLLRRLRLLLRSRNTGHSLPHALADKRLAPDSVLRSQYRHGELVQSSGARPGGARRALATVLEPAALSPARQT